MSTAEIIARLPQLSRDDLARVRATLDAIDATQRTSLAEHPAIGIWKDRTDLPADPVEASKRLRASLMRRTEAESQ